MPSLRDCSSAGRHGDDRSGLIVDTDTATKTEPRSLSDIWTIPGVSTQTDCIGVDSSWEKP